jgi:hypothetical protein
MLEQLKQIAIQNNTMGASIYDLGNVIKSESIAEVTHILKDAEDKQKAMKDKEMQQAQAMQEQALQAKAEEAKLKMQFEADENAKDRESSILQAQIKAAGYGSTVDINQNQQSDYIDALQEINRTNAQIENVNLQREKEINRQAESRENAALKQQELNTKRDIAQTQLQIARENKNKYDKKDKGTKKK